MSDTALASHHEVVERVRALLAVPGVTKAQVAHTCKVSPGTVADLAASPARTVRGDAAARIMRVTPQRMAAARALLPATEAAQRLQECLAQPGVSRRHLVEACGVNHYTISLILDNPDRGIRAATHERIMRLTPGTLNVPARATVSANAAAERLRECLADPALTQREVADAAGISVHILQLILTDPDRAIRASTHARIMRLDPRNPVPLHPVEVTGGPPPTRRSRHTGRGHGMPAGPVTQRLQDCLSYPGVTHQHIADASGVSLSTISLLLAAHPGRLVRPHTHDRIMRLHPGDLHAAAVAVPLHAGPARARLRECLSHPGVTQQQVAAAAGLATNTIRRVLGAAPDARIPRHTYMKIMRLSPKTLHETAAPIPAVVAATRLRECLAHPGVTRQQLADASGVSVRTIGLVLDGSPKRTIRPATFARIMRLHPAPLPPAAAIPLPSARVRAARQVEALQVQGWPAKDIAARAGCDAGTATPSYLRTRASQELSIRIHRVFMELRFYHGPSDVARKRAARAGYVPWAAWDSRIADPDALPDLNGLPLEVKRAARRRAG